MKSGIKFGLPMNNSILNPLIAPELPIKKLFAKLNR